jgi:hypothetical protein
MVSTVGLISQAASASHQNKPGSRPHFEGNFVCYSPKVAKTTSQGCLQPLQREDNPALFLGQKNRVARIHLLRTMEPTSLSFGLVGVVADNGALGDVGSSAVPNHHLQKSSSTQTASRRMAAQTW